MENRAHSGFYHICSSRRRIVRGLINHRLLALQTDEDTPSTLAFALLFWLRSATETTRLQHDIYPHLMFFVLNAFCTVAMGVSCGRGRGV